MSSKTQRLLFMRLRKEKQKSGRKTNLLIALNTMFVIFGLASGFTGTIAWFNSNRSYETTAGSFSISAPPGVEYELYYLYHFTVASPSSSPDGNWNSIIQQFSGYELDYEDAVFAGVEGYEELSSPTPVTPTSPKSINHLWPAHKLTFAIVIKQGDFAKMQLTEWSEETSEDSLLTAGGYVHLSWAIDIYGAAFKVAATNDVIADIATGYRAYRSATPSDVFGYKEVYDLENGEEEPTLPIDVMGSPSGTGTRTIAYFSIEFSNSDETFYEESSLYPKHYSKSTSGNSNCYEQLSLTSLVFNIA